MWQMNAEFYNKLPNVYKTYINEAAKEATDYATKLSGEMEKDQFKLCTDAGVTFCEMVDMTPYLEKVKPVMDAFYKEKWPITTAEEIGSY
jgi:TRAP-type C4-dicarboxylate transport system substrate-binding protein